MARPHLAINYDKIILFMMDDKIKITKRSIFLLTYGVQ